MNGWGEASRRAAGAIPLAAHPEGSPYHGGQRTAQVHGQAFTAGTIFQFEYTLVPEPGVMALLATACGLLFLLPRSSNHLKLFFSSGTHPRQRSHPISLSKTIGHSTDFDRKLQATSSSRFER